VPTNPLPIRFDHVSKRYRLGQARVSLPGLVSGWLGRDLTRDADHVDALHDVSFEVERGGSLALVGPNGAGKTTILKLLARITQPSQGTVSVGGRVSALIELGAGFHGDLTGRDNVFLNGAILGIRRRELRRRFDDIVSFAGLERFIDTPVKRYSSGMIVRLGFAVAASIEPDVLLVDEVLAVGDAAFSQKCLARIRDLVSHGTTLVFVSHNPYLVRASCRAALYVRDGRVVCAGSADEAIRAYDQDVARSTPIGTSGAGERGQADVVITAVDVVVDGRVNPTDTVSSDAGAQIRVAYHAAVDAGRAQAAVFIRRADGLICCAARSHIAGAALSIHKGAGTVSLHIDKLQLTGGAYCAEAYLLDSSDSVVFTPDGKQSPWFTVIGQGFVATNDTGIFQPVVRWSQDQSGERPPAAAARLYRPPLCPTGEEVSTP